MTYRDLPAPSANAGITHLLALCRPATVLGAVMTIVVDAIKAAPEWTFAHIRQERIERMKPTVAHGNAAATVIPVTWVFAIRAALLRRCPTGVGSRLGVAMRHGVFASHFSQETAARSSVPESDIARTDGDRGPAVAASDKPPVPADVPGSFADDNEPTVTMSEFFAARLRHDVEYSALTTTVCHSLIAT